MILLLGVSAREAQAVITKTLFAQVEAGTR
jgi:hypothetical protein